MLKKLKILLMVSLLAVLNLAGCDSGGNEKNAPQKSVASEPVVQDAAPPVIETPAADSPAAEASPIENEADAPEESPVVAVVNGAPISRQLFDSQVIMAGSNEMVFGQTENADSQMQEAADLSLRLEVLNALIDLELACQEAIRRGYAPPDDEVTAAFEKMRSESEDPDNFHKLLDQYGESNEEMRNQLTKTMALRKWQENDFLAKMTVTADEARAFYEANKADMAHEELADVAAVFLSVPLGSLAPQKEKARKKAEEALKRLKRGEDFAAVAMTVSDAPDAAQTRGEMGWLEKTRSMPVFDEAIFKMKPGEITDIVESPMGFHIFKVNKFKPAGIDSFEEMRPGIVEFMSAEKLHTAVREAMDELRRKGNVEIHDQKLKAAWEKAQAAVQ